MYHFKPDNCWEADTAGDQAADQAGVGPGQEGQEDFPKKVRLEPKSEG